MDLGQMQGPWSDAQCKIFSWTIVKSRPMDYEGALVKFTDP